MLTKTALFLACGKLYDDKWSAVRTELITLAQKLREAGYFLKEDFFMNGIACAGELTANIAPLIELYEDEMMRCADRDWMLYEQLIRVTGARKVIAMCDLSKDDQIERLRSILAACRIHRIQIRLVVYDSDDWAD